MLYFLCTVAAVISFAASDCNVVSIEEWSGTHSNRIEKLLKPVNLVVVQHTVTSECFTDSDCQKLVNTIRNYQKLLNFSDITMSFLVGGNGKLYEGAGWHVGAHTRGYNNKSISISFIGDFRTKLPTNVALQAALDFLSCSVDNKDLGDNYALVGHQQLSPTLSPGAKLQSEITTWPHWRADVSQLKPHYLMNN